MRRAAILLLLCACGPKEGGTDPARPEAAQPPDRESWWKGATTHPSGAERILAPRELRVLLRQGEDFGFNGDAAWWRQRTDWVYDRILEIDADDVEANAGKGFKTLQSYPGFKKLWMRMLEARVTNKDIDELLQLYDRKVQDGETVFLQADAYTIEAARLNRAAAHLDKLAGDPEYAALQTALARVRGTSLNDFPYVHKRVGPFLVFYSARDLQVIEGEDEAAEQARVAARREVYVRRLDKLASAYRGLLKDIETLYPALWKAHKPAPREIHFQWIFGEAEWYNEHAQRLQKEDPETTYRTGFVDAKTGWAFLFVPTQAKDKDGKATGPASDDVLRETAVYLAARQLLHRWGKDEKILQNRLDRSRAYWLKVGWPSYLASRSVESPQVGHLIRTARTANSVFPPLSRVVERESRLELRLYREPRHEFHEDEEERPQLPIRASFTDLSWLLVRYLSGEKHRAAFQQYMETQIAGRHPEVYYFEKAFGIDGEAGWTRFQRAVYGTIGKNGK